MLARYYSAAMTTRLAVIYTRAAIGLDAPLVRVEVHISNGLPKLNIVGLPETAVRESKDRVRSAILSSNFEFPTRRITINLAPADLPKDGGRFDLPIAIGILAASDQIPSNNLDNYEFAGELALSGQLRAISGALPLAIATRRAQRHLIIAADNAHTASLPQDNIVFAAHSLTDVCAHLQTTQLLQPFVAVLDPYNFKGSGVDLADIHGQTRAKRALEITAAGGHSMLMCGPPGTGKSMLATRLITILPPLSLEEALEVEAIYSLTKFNSQQPAWLQRPFRSPHHTVSSIALAGGCSPPQPGEISLAHRGILFLDELPEFSRNALEVLREPLESGVIAISRAARKAAFPAQFQLIAAMNPCPCGQLGNPNQSCRCASEQVERYQNKLSGPLLDRIDINIELPVITLDIIDANPTNNCETSATVKQRVLHAMQLQHDRGTKLNAKYSNQEITKFAKLDKSGRTILRQAIEQLALSARGYYRVLKVARTIADLAQSAQIQDQHLLEALSFRSRIMER